MSRNIRRAVRRIRLRNVGNIIRRINPNNGVTEQSTKPIENTEQQNTYNNEYADIGLEGIETDFTKGVLEKVKPEETQLTHKDKLTKMLKIK